MTLVVFPLPRVCPLSAAGPCEDAATVPSVGDKVPVVNLCVFVCVCLCTSTYINTYLPTYT
jgi:hypothetical protein